MYHGQSEARIFEFLDASFRSGLPSGAHLIGQKHGTRHRAIDVHLVPAIAFGVFGLKEHRGIKDRNRSGGQEYLAEQLQGLVGLVHRDGAQVPNDHLAHVEVRRAHVETATIAMTLGHGAQEFLIRVGS